MSNKSIDGLRRKPEHTIGLPTAKPLKPAKTPKNHQPPEENAAIRDFLTSVQDTDPTDMIGLPPEKTEEQPPLLSDKDHKKALKRAKKAQQPPKKKHKIRNIILLAIGIPLLLAIGAGTWLFIQGNDLISRVTGGGNLIDAIFSDPDIPLKSDPTTSRTNVLIFGTEGYSMDDPNYDGGQLTDSMMVASIHQETGDIKTVSLPRDLRSKTCTATSKLNEVYYCTYSKNSGSTESRQEYESKAALALAAEAEKILGLKIQYFIHVNWAALIHVVDAIGGIDVAFVYQGESWNGPEVAIETTSKKGLADQYNKACRCYDVNYENGKVYHLNGTQALAVARTRNAYGGWGAIGGNFSREVFQQKIIQAAALKAKNTNFVTDFMAALSIKNAVGDNLRMNFEDTELKTILKLATTVDIGAMQTISLVNPTDHTPLLTTACDAGNGISYVCPTAGLTTYTTIHEYIARKFTSDPATSENADITVMNATTVTGLAATEVKKLTAKGLAATADNAPAALQDTEGIVIYQLTPSMTNTAKTLADFYDVKITTTIPESLTNNQSDFIIIIGSGYAN